MRIETKAAILAYISDKFIELEAVDFLPSDFWDEFEDVLTLSGFVTSQWANPTLSGTKAIEAAYDILCDIREVNPLEDFQTLEDFFLSQAVDE